MFQLQPGSQACATEHVPTAKHVCSGQQVLAHCAVQVAAADLTQVLVHFGGLCVAVVFV